MVYIILGKGFEPMEAIAPCDILRRGGAEVRFAGIGGTLIEGGHGISVQADCTVEQMKLADTDMVLLPGGLGGVHSILASETSMNFIRLAYEKTAMSQLSVLRRLFLRDFTSRMDARQPAIPAWKTKWAQHR